MVSGISVMSTSSLAEMRQKMFDQIDTNGDGSLDKSEIAALIEQNTSNMVDNIFAQMDTDGDSAISKIESNAEMSKLGQEMKGRGPGMQTTQGPPPEEVFETADTDGDGMVSEDELAAVMGAEGADISRLFSEVDTDGDGLISKTEDEAFRAQMTDQRNQSESSDTGTDSVAGLDQDWQNRIFTALLKSMIAGYTAKENSTSVYV